MRRPAAYLPLMTMFAMMDDHAPPSIVRKRRRRPYDIEPRKPRPKRLDNSPDRAKGMKEFVIDGVSIYAGTPKAARKKARLLAKNPRS